MKIKFSFLYLFFILSFNLIRAQGEAAVPFLYVNPSPQSLGLGWSGVSYPSNDAYAFYYNPAMLGHFGQENNLSIQTYPGKSEWIFDWITVNSYGLNIGYNFKNELNGINLSVGAGYLKNRISFGDFISPSGAIENYDKFDTYAFGAAIDYYVTFAAGISFKNIYSLFAYTPAGEKADADINAIDYGFLLTLPVTDLFDDISIELSGSKIIPEFNYSIGYSRSNIGDEIWYIDESQKDPLPLTARLGHTLSFSFDYEAVDLFINLFKYDLILEADDMLIKRDVQIINPGTDSVFTQSKINYQGLLGEIDLSKHLIQLKSDEDVIVHKGHSISFVETVTLLYGSFAGRGYTYLPSVKNNGLIISSRGIFKWLGSVSDNNILHFLAKHIELKYVNSTIFDGHGYETDFSGLSVSFMNFSFN